jgi:predicted GNAT family acetyltransferase
MGDETQVTVTVTEAPEREAYVVAVDGEPAGLLAYRRVPDRTVFLHTEVDDRFEGRGIGSQLIRAALDGERARGHQVEPRCPFVAAFIRRHPEDADLVPERYRALLDE